MATPTEAEVTTQLQNAAHVVEETREFGQTDATNLLGLLDTLEQSLEGEHVADLAAAASAYRRGFSDLLTPSRVRSFLDPVFRQWGRVAQAPETEGDVKELIKRIYDRMQDTTAARISSRQFTRGAIVAAGGNVGNGTILRLNVNEDNYALEASFAEVKTFQILRDANSGAEEHEEVFQVRGQAPTKDSLEIIGSESGILTELRCQSSRDSLLRNASFQSFSGTAAAPTAITNWTVSTIGNVQVDQVNFYRDFPGATTPASLRLNNNVNVSQALSVRREALNRKRPYLLQIAYNRAIGGGDGTLTIRMGSRSIAVVLAAQAGWNILRLAIDQNLWFENFNEQDFDIRIELTGRTVGYTLVNDVLFLPWVMIDGTYWVAIGGATPFLVNDSFTFTDTELATGIIQRLIWWAYASEDDDDRMMLPHATGGAITIADP